MLDSYRLFRKGRPRRRDGEVVLYDREGLDHLEHDDDSDDKVECL